MQDHLFLIEQGLEELGLMDDLEVPAKLGILILKSVITVGAGREDFFDLIPLKAPRKIQPIHFGVLGQGLHPEGLGPVSPLALFNPPGIAFSFHTPKDFLEFIMESALHENAASPHVDDLVITGDEDRTLFVTVQTGRAGPDSIL